jgi:hypothetical protein
MPAEKAILVLLLIEENHGLQNTLPIKTLSFHTLEVSLKTVMLFLHFQ